MSNAKNNARWPAIVFLLTRQPRTVRQLGELSGAHKRTVCYVLDLLKMEGLIREAGKETAARGRPARKWEWAA